MCFEFHIEMVEQVFVIANSTGHTSQQSGGINNMKVIVTSIFVEDQDKALQFYSETLGFVKKHDVPAGEFRWITLVSPEDQKGTEIVLEQIGRTHV